MSKCHFGVKQVHFLGRTITPPEVAPQADKVKNFLPKTLLSQIKKGVTKEHRIPKLLPKLHSPFFKLLKDTSKFYVPTNLVEDFTNLNKLLENYFQLALKQPLKNKQLIVMPDANFIAAGYAIMIEDEKTFYHIRRFKTTIQTQN